MCLLLFFHPCENLLENILDTSQFLKGLVQDLELGLGDKTEISLRLRFEFRVR